MDSFEAACMTTGRPSKKGAALQKQNFQDENEIDIVTS